MAYLISYDAGGEHGRGASRKEYYMVEAQALRRARQLLKYDDHRGVALHDASGDVLTGIQLELRLGLAAADDARLINFARVEENWPERRETPINSPNGKARTNPSGALP
jgi:hypothetical protein